MKKYKINKVLVDSVTIFTALTALHYLNLLEKPYISTTIAGFLGGWLIRGALTDSELEEKTCS